MKPARNSLEWVKDIVRSHGGGLWYLASPYSKYPAGVDQAASDVSFVAARLLEAGVSVFSPIAHSSLIALSGGLDALDHDIWLPLDRHMMNACRGMIVAQMDGWDTSYGVGVELDHFDESSKPVLMLDVGVWLNEAQKEEPAAGREDRKNFPLASGVLDYFPDALMEVAAVSKAGNDKHNPGQPMHHARGKSMDHPDALLRHLKDRGNVDSETGRRHSGEMAWRALALLQEEIEQEKVAAGARIEDVMARGARA